MWGEPEWSVSQRSSEYQKTSHRFERHEGESVMTERPVSEELTRQTHSGVIIWRDGKPVSNSCLLWEKEKERYQHFCSFNVKMTSYRTRLKTTVTRFRDKRSWSSWSGAALDLHTRVEDRAGVSEGDSQPSDSTIRFCFVTDLEMLKVLKVMLHWPFDI